ncbi:hypothetical protein ACN2MM_02025 [Alkalilimnicola ehrlichii MLHE-1]|uniref:Uncharacterized protein n=1 Tax=Alkalilimnicola ehrlichii (strain ATCC BAA-1101 / DSM 17681 / MLHE-1) TaxID=187272 RepID=Q0ABX8_ALKEH|nr:hypothetical protein [Alkalilimnicola ehrlichii]ABI55659.1 hypothetical protein Mlg_0304 [Alkalilimnicola ehrlichii MLHE-1]
MLQVPPLVDPVRNAAKPRTPPTIESILPVSPYPVVHPRQQEDTGEERREHRPLTAGSRPRRAGAPTDSAVRRDQRTDDQAPAAPRDRPSLGIDEYA